MEMNKALSRDLNHNRSRSNRRVRMGIVSTLGFFTIALISFQGLANSDFTPPKIHEVQLSKTGILKRDCGTSEKSKSDSSCQNDKRFIIQVIASPEKKSLSFNYKITDGDLDDQQGATRTWDMSTASIASRMEYFKDVFGSSSSCTVHRFQIPP